jgi:membrane fusion protein, multidrug efflux system
MKKLHSLVAVVGIALATGAAYWYQHRAPSAVDKASSGAVPAARSGTTAPAAGSAGGGGGPVTVEVGKVTTMSLRDEALAVGTLRSRQGVMLRPEVSGRIARLGFTDGQRVRRGQVLVQLDASLQKAQLLQAQAQASIARTNLQRNRDLMAQNFVSQSAADQSAAALEVAQAQVALAQAQLERMSILAPFDGVTGIRNVNVGDYVKDGADMVMVEDQSAMLVDFRLPERVIARLKPKQGVDVSLDSLVGKQFKGVVEAVDSQLDSNGRSLLVRARIENPQSTLRSGMFARTRIVFETREGALVVPEEAIVPLGSKQFLIKVIDGPAAKMSQRIEARLGLRVAGKVEVLEGLAANDLVVTAGQARLMRGESQALKIVEVGSGAGQTGASEKPAAAASGAGGDAAATPAAARASSAV